MWKILVVDDAFENRQILVEILRDFAVCDTAANGKEAVEAYNRSVKSNSYDLILLDVAMPEINGIDFLNLVRENEKKAGIPLGNGIPIIMVTAYKEPFMDAFNKGCDDYIVKPIDPSSLLKKIEDKLGKLRN